jgi:hypothetical protein
VEPDARQRIRKALAEAGRRIAVLDDDPTGSQTVHDVAVVTVFDPEEIAAGLDGPGSTCFILTNTRSMDETDAVALNTRVGRTVFELSRRLDAPVDVISRSDSTLRGHGSAASRHRSARRSSPATPPSASPPRTCASSSPRKVAAPSRRTRCTASRWTTSAAAAHNASPRSSPG